MTIRKIKVNGNEYEFVNNSRSTRSGFAHDTTLFKNDCVIRRASCHYLNRTWECYQYQTVMLRCVSEEIDREYNRFIDNYKYTNGIKRMTAEKRGEADKEFESREDIKELRKVYKKLNDRD
jgi:transcription elongation factor Elf1